ncbi:hypothetical protein HYH03_016335 [Edaphochlamys debaryana]|uniref:Uncharacterized protein n=1 Tax=Edaphochlamys debaryana TaxID=47281 RepID=A0A835XHN8_9CHLO|nr:hypothetical protein HYH03_016335 [Edaphochlamys debaryana]|eukprot:KAG2484847.1 hypothetical protein HYH03_016335 [Edaphochlamys debaryana]
MYSARLKTHDAEKVPFRGRYPDLCKDPSLRGATLTFKSSNKACVNFESSIVVYCDGDTTAPSPPPHTPPPVVEPVPSDPQPVTSSSPPDAPPSDLEPADPQPSDSQPAESGAPAEAPAEESPV